MHPEQIILLLINVIGGVLVIGSYVWGIKTNPQGVNALWGGVPSQTRGLYFASMILAAISYFLFTFFILFKLNPAEVKIANVFSFGLFQIIYILILLPSALWMPLGLVMLENPKTIIWWSIRLVLIIVALASLALLLSLLFLSPKQSGAFYWLAVAGITIFFLHTAILDALLWPLYFNAK